MTETYQPPVRPMREVLPAILPELNSDTNYGLLATLDAFQRFGNHGFVTQDETSGDYSFVAVPEQIAHSMGGPQPRAEAFTLSSEDTLVLADGKRVPYSQAAFTEALKAGAAKIEIVRSDTQGQPRNFDIELSSLYGNKVLVAQILDTSEQKMAEKLNQKIEQLNFLKQARIAIDSALTVELASAHPSEKNFMAAAISALKPVLDPTNSSEVVIYESSSAQETAALLLDKLASTNEKTSPLLTQEVAVRTREINNIRFPAVTSVLMDNSEGFKMVTAVASFPSGSQPDFQKIMAIFSKEPLSPTIADQLPYVM